MVDTAACLLPSHPCTFLGFGMTFFIRVLVQRGDTSWENWLGLGAIAAPLSSAFFATLFHR